MKHTLYILLIAALCAGCSPREKIKDSGDLYSAKPYSRWWWFSAVIDTNDVKDQLHWLRDNHFGGVEVAFVYPYNNDTLSARYAWLSREWAESVTFAKRHAAALGLGCDFTFGTLWPFGDSQVPENEGSRYYGRETSEKRMRLTWESPLRGRVINHLDRRALDNYSTRLGNAFGDALTICRQALFCDSWEVEVNKLWTEGFDEKFTNKYGYDIEPYMEKLLEPGNEDIFYDYMKLISEYVLYEFYAPLTDNCHRFHSCSRAQCGGAPTDLLTAFSLVDIPETEAILYEPNFARIPFSSAVLASQKIVSAETFTCTYGWKGWPGPGPYQKREQIADLKLIADALFANGVNMIIWHGMPYNKIGGDQIFYASVHVGPDAYFTDELSEFNRYMEKVSTYMRRGSPYADIAVYYPLEDAWMGGEYPDSLQFPWVWGEYELRYIRTAVELTGYQPIWINTYFLQRGKVRNGKLVYADNAFAGLYVDVGYLDLEGLQTILSLAKKGVPVCLKKDPAQPGRAKSPVYSEMLSELKSLPNVSGEIEKVLTSSAVVEGDSLPDYICRLDGGSAYLFFANPRAKNLHYPLAYGQSLETHEQVRHIRVNLFGLSKEVMLRFPPYQSLLLHMDINGTVEFIDISFVPKTPVRY